MSVTELASIHPFVRRQVADSKFSYYDGDFEDAIEVVTIQEWDSAEVVQLESGQIRKVRLSDTRDFYSSIVKIDDDTELVATSDARQEDEESHIVVEAYGNKMPAKSVTLIFYDREALGEDDAIVDIEGGWFLISINASPFEKDFPMNPLTMARNQMGKIGGTKREYTPQEWAEAVWFWSQHALVSENA
tara:strand:+ start:359 stop:925 length:567 start_codon:yes stop_codon:yes gene_type:complete